MGEQQQSDLTVGDGLALEVSFTLSQHGYDPLNEAQRFELRLHLTHLLAGDRQRSCPGSVA